MFTVQIDAEPVAQHAHWQLVKGKKGAYRIYDNAKPCLVRIRYTNGKTYKELGTFDVVTPHHVDPHDLPDLITDLREAQRAITKFRLALHENYMKELKERDQQQDHHSH